MTYEYWLSATDAITGEPVQIDATKTTYVVRGCDECEDGRYFDGTFCLTCGGLGVIEQIPDEEGD